MRVGKGPPPPKKPAKVKTGTPPAPVEKTGKRVGVPADRRVTPPTQAAPPTPRTVDDHRYETTGRKQSVDDRGQRPAWIVDDETWRTPAYSKYADLGLEWNGREAVCRYGCGGTTANVSGICYHRWDCAYWEREGKTRTPFD